MDVRDAGSYTGRVADMTFTWWSRLGECIVASAALLLLTSWTPSLSSTQSSSTKSPRASNAVILDVSDSTAQTTRIRKRKLIESLQRLVQNYDESQYYLIGVSTTPTIILDNSIDEYTVSREISKLLSKRREGGTALYDACYLGIERLKQTTFAKRNLIVVSDGIDTMSVKSLRDVENALSDNNVRLYAIAVPTQIELTHKGIRTLNALASASGGLSFYPTKSEDLDAIVDNVLAELKK